IGSFPTRFAAGSILFSAAARLLPAHLLGNHRRRATAGFLNRGLNAHLAEDCATSLVNLLHYADRTSMAFSVESRMPFLDVRLAEFLAATPEAYKIHDGWTKYIARAAFDGELPDEVTWRRDKMGWPVPEAAWRQGFLNGWFAGAEAAIPVFASYGLRAPFLAATRSANITDRVRALNLASWHGTYVDAGWRRLAA
ncbi:MAG: hypothetical protein JOZ27_08160, partial [Caulobacteraceae bacterium]|nr:hypothetical protein [Caulobacteraceae bacterium]